MTDDGGTLPVEDLVEYCRTQAGLLSGRVETIGAEVDDLLDDIDEDIAALRTRLAEQANGADGSAVSPPTAGANDGGSEPAELAALEAAVEELETELGEKQTIAEAKRARMAAFEDLAAAYLELAEDLRSSVDDGSEALDRVVGFERDRDAPAYFDDRETLLEAAAGPDGSADG